MVEHNTRIFPVNKTSPVEKKYQFVKFFVDFYRKILAFVLNLKKIYFIYNIQINQIFHFNSIYL